MPAGRTPWRSARGRRRGRAGVDGRVQAVVDGRAVGWAWDAANPGERVTVEVEVEAEVVAEGVAEIFRDELAREEIGDGAHGFVLDLPIALQAREQVRLIARAGPERVVLPRSPSFWFQAAETGPWSGVRFRYGREGDPEPASDEPLLVPPPPEPPPPEALIGRDGWLFPAAQLRERATPTAADVERAAGELAEIAAACGEIGIAYIPALVPDKLQAVAEGAPVGLDRAASWGERLRVWLRDADDLEVLDLRGVLDDARRHGPCFARSDPEWNDRGAFFVARALIKEARKRVPTLRPLPMARLHLVDRPGWRGTLADAPTVRWDGDRLAPIGYDFTDEQAVAIDTATLEAQRMPVDRHLTGAGTHVRLLAMPEGGGSPRLAVVGDAACPPVLTWLAECAQRTTFFWAVRPPMEPVELELPDVLLHLIRERDLQAGLAGQPAQS